MIKLTKVEAEGFGVFRERIEVDLADRGRVIILGENNDTNAADSNGAGKTTLLKAITWGLFGVTLDGLATADVIHKGETSAEVRVTFRVEGGSEFRVTRRRTPKTGKLTFEELDEEESELIDRTQTKARATQAAIEETLAIDFETFRCTVLFGQGDHSRFASRTLGDAARKEILSKVLGLGRYEAARDTAKVESARLAQKIRDLDAEIGVLSRAESARKVELAGLLGRRSEFPSAVALEEKVHAEEDARVAAEDDWTTARAEAEEAREFAAEVEEELAEVAARLRDWRGREARAAAELAAAEDHLTLVSDPGGGTCRSCGQELPAGDVDPEKVEKAKERHAAALEGAKVARRGIDLLTKKEGELRAELRSERDRVAEQDALARAKRREATRHGEERDRLTAEKDELAARALELDEKIEELERLSADAKSEWAVLDAEKEDLAKKEAIASWWVKVGFGPKGVPAYAIEQALPVINTRANRHLLQLADGDIRVEWSATTEGSSGATKEILNQTVTIEGVEGATPSGGQQKKIELATELALSEMKRESEGIGMDALFIDEALDGLDAEGQRRVVEWLELLGAGSIFVISHDPGIAEDFDETIVVRKEGGSSTIEGGRR